jgi:hypothetical protein
VAVRWNNSKNLGGIFCRAIPAGHLSWAWLKSGDTVFCCPAGAGRCPTNANEREKEARRRKQRAGRVHLGEPRPNNENDVADHLEAQAAERWNDKVRELFATLLRLVDPATASWEQIDSASQEEWAAALRRKLERNPRRAASPDVHYRRVNKQRRCPAKRSRSCQGDDNHVVALGRLFRARRFSRGTIY